MEVRTTNQHEDYAKIFKVLADSSRLKIIEILSCGERCACEIQAYFSFTQPTLSHHMKILMASGLVSSRKEGQWIYYALKNDRAQDLMTYFNNLVSDTQDCPCHELKNLNGGCHDKSKG